jgi:glutamyl-tRNA reductase
VYFSGDNLAEVHSELLQVLREEIFLHFEHEIYSYFGIDCFLHLAHVVSGLDSVIIAESEIQRQVKVAYEQVQLHYFLPSCMHFLFQKALKIGKEIRGQLTPGKMTLSKMLFTIGEDVVRGFANAPLLFIGNSEVNRQVMIFFRRRGIKRLFLCTRALHSAQEFAHTEGVTLLPWQACAEWGAFPVVICGSNASQYLIQRPEGAVKTELIFDLSVPRNVDPQVARHPNISLLNMEEISQMLGHHQIKNEREIGRATERIFECVSHYTQAFRHKSQRSVGCVL